MNTVFLFAQNNQAEADWSWSGLLFKALAFLCAGVILFLVYIAPIFIARVRKHQNLGTIFMLTMFLGWTGIGWLLALAWSFSAVVEQTSYRGSYDYDDTDGSSAV